MLKNPPLKDDTSTLGKLLGNMIVELKEIVKGFFPEKGETPEGNEAVTQADEDEMPKLMQYALKALYLIAQQIEIDGVELTQADKDAGVTYYEKAILAVLHCGAEIKLDAKDGFHVSATVTVGKAHITIAEKLEVIDTESTPLSDLYKEYEEVKDTDNAKAWKDIDELWNELFPKKPDQGEGNNGEEA